MTFGTTTHPGGKGAALPQESGAVLGLDYGRARIGLAIALEAVRITRPLETLVRKNRNEDMRRLRDIVRKHGVTQIVVGLPLRLDGTRGEMAEEAERFAERLRKQFGLPVELVDERLTSWEAEELLRESAKEKNSPQRAQKNHGEGRHRDAASAAKKREKKERALVDAMAAAVILREYFERTRRVEEMA